MAVPGLSGLKEIAFFKDQGLALGMEDFGFHHLTHEQGMVSGGEGVHQLQVKVGIRLGQNGGAACRREGLQAGEFVDFAAAFVAEAFGQFHLVAGQAR